MKVQGKHYRTIWAATNNSAVCIIDQTRLPHEFVSVELNTAAEMAHAIQSMQVRGAPLIGVAAAYGMYLAAQENSQESNLRDAYEILLATRPTAINLRWGLDRTLNTILQFPPEKRAEIALKTAKAIADEDVVINQGIAQHALKIIHAHWQKKQRPIHILTHCNAGWLATVDWGTALSGVYAAHEAGIPVHVWVDETRPRNQGASLTAWELQAQDIPHTLIVDNLAGLLMQQQKVDLCIVGTDRATASGHICNKVGTYLKALAAFDNHIPFYAAAPSPSFDWKIYEMTEIPIEARDSEEVLMIHGRDKTGQFRTISIAPENTNALNYAFDITPRKYLTGIITERGCSHAHENSLKELFPEYYPLFVEN
ncbi:MAG: S-methyl-5-thioribose-1-phosphate isomerase [Coxiella sp. RIFCSPHIGHO2_12_FULL_42_15]|nr:MAG: S-methyl-5-thioribose-1-phosphate isomerase [Coxiella sp. RIFCSPHIGHO2_12_FULL_42_15]